MTGRPAWATRVFEEQHRVWPAWAESMGGARDLVAMLTEWLQLAPGGRVLDLGCGSGREVVALAELGFRCTGIDASEALVARARRRAEAAQVSDRASFYARDAAEIADLGMFDGVLMLDSTLAVLEAAGHDAIASTATRQLDAGGWFVVEQLNRERFEDVDDAFVVESPAVGPGRTERHYLWDSSADLLTDRVTWWSPEGAPHPLPTQLLKLRSAADLERKLSALGLEQVSLRRSGPSGWPEASQSVRDALAVIVAGRRSVDA